MQHSTTLSTTIQHLNEKFAEQKDTISKLENQLDDLIQAKKTHEEELLAKFALLLNEKKLKIREQQRLLAGAKLDPNAAKKVGATKAKEVPKGRTPQPSRKGKRKIDVKDESESENEDGFENNNRVATAAGGTGVEDTDADDGEGDEQVETPEASEGDVTEDDDDDLDAGAQDQDARAKDQAKETPHNPSKNNDNGKMLQIDTLPPSRALPFDKHDISGSSSGKEKQTTQKVTDKSILNQEAGNEDDETEDDDDEL